jgi:hypothetical protein
MSVSIDPAQLYACKTPLLSKFRDAIGIVFFTSDLPQINIVREKMYACVMSIGARPVEASFYLTPDIRVVPLLGPIFVRGG